MGTSVKYMYVGKNGSKEREPLIP